MAALWPKGLEIILNAGIPIDVSIKSNGRTPLAVAILCSKENCVRPSLFKRCSNCPCTKAVELLLDFGCFLDAEEVDFALEKIDSPPVAYVLMEHIRRWRLRLAEMAYAYLTESERGHLGITHDSGVLDTIAPDVIHKLESKGVFPHSILKLRPGDYRLSPPVRPSRGCSIYCEFSNYSTAQQAFELGFKDFDVPHSRGETTLSELARSHVDSRRIPFVLFILYCTWLNNHGASLIQPMQWQWRVDHSEFLYPDEVPQHLVAHCLMTSPRLRTESTDATYRIRGKAAGKYDVPYQCQTMEAPDGCRCACSENIDGCDPLTMFLTSAQRFGQGLDDIAHAFERLYRPNADSATLSRMAFAIIRCLTFEELELRHTCCNTLWRERRDDREPNLDKVFGHPARDYGEDFPYIREEDEPLIIMLEELVAEFKQRFLLEDCPIPAFLDGYWKKRMEQVKREMRAVRLTDNERDAIVAIGVEKWEEDVQANVSGGSDQLSEEPHLDPAEVLYWTRMLDKITC